MPHLRTSLLDRHCTAIAAGALLVVVFVATSGGSGGDRVDRTSTALAATARPVAVAAPAPGGAQQALFVPPLLQPRMDGATKVFSLTARAGSIRRFGETLATAGFNGAYLAPTIRVRRGERVRMEVDNALREPTTVHWHGLHVAPTGDGGPYQPIPAGGSWAPELTVSQPAATLWYHPHVMGQTAPQVGRGMAGLLLIDEDTPAQRALPHRYGVDDVPVLLQGAPLPASGRATGRRPLLANGTPNAVLRTRATRLRLRLVNGTGGAILGVNVRGATAVRVVGSDGGLLPAAVRTSRVVLGPSERSELVVDVRAGSTVRLATTVLPDQGAEVGRTHDAFLRGAPVDATSGTVLTIVNTTPRTQARAAASAARVIPARLAAAPSLDLSRAVERDMVLGPGIEINGELMTDVDHEHGAHMPGTLRIPLDQVEVWTIDNRSPFTHVFHVHDIEFQVLDRDGVAPSAVERGWKDSIHVSPGTSARIAMQFTDFADADHPYMFHCHVLRHEDAGMMGQFVVIPRGEAA